MRVKSRKPPAEYFRISELGDVAKVERGADDVVGDQVRHVAGHGQNQIVMFRRHDLDAGAERLPELRQPFDGGCVGVFRRRQDAPAVDEQLGEAGIGPGIFGAGDRMARNEMDACRAGAAPFAHHGGFHRADVGDDGAGFEVWADFFRHRVRRRRSARRR